LEIFLLGDKLLKCLLGLGLSETMKEDLLPFLLGIGLLIAYLVFSAMTEMGTRWPWKKRWKLRAIA
jgi:hypothetical protein